MFPFWYEGIWPVEELSAIGEQCLNCLSQPRGPPHGDINVFFNELLRYSANFIYEPPRRPPPSEWIQLQRSPASGEEPGRAGLYKRFRPDDWHESRHGTP